MIYRPLWIVLLFLLFAPAGCDYGRMYDQESVRTHEKKMPPGTPGAVPVTGGTEGLRRTDPRDLKNPLSPTASTISQGKEVYFSYCVQCHGPRADGKGTVGQSFAPLPVSLTDPRVLGHSDGELFVDISLGAGRHPALATTVSEPDRWAVIHYLRSLKGEGKG
jgi:mono/diheme cytochrome c family protein